MTVQEDPSTIPSSSSATSVFDVSSSSRKSSSSHRRVDLSVLARRVPLRSASRPSSAPGQDKISLLPSIPSRWISPIDDPVTHVVTEIPISERPDAIPLLQAVKECGSAAPTTPSLESKSEFFLSPFNSEGNDSMSSSHVDSPLPTVHAEYDWATFINAYASGQWDPHRTPNPPRSCMSTSSSLPLLSETVSSAPPFGSQTAETIHLHDSSNAFKLSQTRLEVISAHLRSHDNVYPVPPTSSVSLSSRQSSHSPSLRRFRPAAPTSINLPTHRMRSSFSTSSAPLPSPGGSPGTPPNISHLNSEVQTTAATLRWAAARVDISPLALPSPEHELTDPMRGATATVPGSYPDYDQNSDHPYTPGGSRKTRLTKFWHGTTNVDPASNDGHLHPSDNLTTSQQHGHLLSSTYSHLGHIPATSAPQPQSYHDNQTPAADYFEVASGPHTSNSAYDRANGHVHEDVLHPASADGTMSVPALPTRVCLARQTSSPLPEASSQEVKSLGGRVASENIAVFKVHRSAKEEQMFADLGYLAPPNPSDELERRRALYKFNIWNTGPDLNFDRIAHLAKLVFSTKGVLINLIDGNEQWHKSEWGIKIPSHPRAHSFCAHTILQRGDEPMVILDTHLDWRFARNPLVTGAPHIRFYAGAPLRTADGFNIGTLSVICDSPRDDFSARNKHTLKEFAAIAMREMELWRDKIQLRIRDRIQTSMEQFSRECLEIDTETHGDGMAPIASTSMDKVYDRAAKLVQRTLDVEGVIVMDISHCEVLESMSAEGTVSVTLHYGDPQIQATKRQLSSDEYHKLNAFFSKYPDGKISEGIVPASFRPFLPTHMHYALAVPIFNIDKRPFALLCAYNSSEQTKRYLEGHELSYLRAIGVIILSAVLKRRMILADKAKSLFISNISHELRTPLHGILAAAELLSDTNLNHSQLSFLQTVQACGTSLVETVNHVLDFTKLSGNSKAGGVENVIAPSKVDLMQLVEEAVDGSWIGYQARTAAMGDSGIGSVYSPPKEAATSPIAVHRATVETVIDIGYRREGWAFKCERGGLRRVLMNLFGNSLKFTVRGYVHVVLRELPSAENDPPNKVKIELAVLDTGKGISQNFLKNQLFHPFSQENPLQTGTGLGLAIVNSIVNSESVGGKVDVWSEEGTGTEIKITFFAEKVEDQVPSSVMAPFKLDNSARLPNISLIGFDISHDGARLLRRVLQDILHRWWGFEIHTGIEYGDIVILDEDISKVQSATDRRDISRPFIVLSSARGDPTLMTVASEFEKIGGFCRILFKPCGPSRLRAILNLCLHSHKISSRSRVVSAASSVGSEVVPTVFSSIQEKERTVGSSIPRRKSDESHNIWLRSQLQRPSTLSRSLSVYPISSVWQGLTPPPSEQRDSLDIDSETMASTVPVGSGGSLLESCLRPPQAREECFRVLVVEDNSILRSLLIKWLSQKGYDFRSAVDGREGVTLFESEGPFDVVLLDLSMPVLDGIAATSEIRLIESKRGDARCNARILALTGMSSLEDKRRAFEAGVDGYLVKPVAFKTLDEMFHKMGLT